MGDSQINIIISTLKRGTGDRDTKNALKDIGKSFQNATGLSLSYAGAATAVVSITKKLIDITKESVEGFTEQANRIEKLAAITGSSAEDLSRFLEVADDVKLSGEAIEKAFEAATRKGIDTSVESLARLSDEYLSLAPGLERAKFLTDTFGKSGSEMYKVMKLGGAAIRERSTAVSASLVIDQKAIELSNAYQLSVDNVSDSWTGLKNILAQEAMPVLTASNNILAEIIGTTAESNNVWREAVYWYNTAFSAINPFTNTLRNLKGILLEVNDAIVEKNEGLKGSTRIFEETTTAVVDYSKAYASSTSYIEKFMDLQGKSATEVELATHRIILSMLEKKLAEDGLSQAEMQYLLELGKQWRIYSEKAVTEMNKAYAAAMDLARAINGVPSAKEIKLEISTTYSTKKADPYTITESARAEGGPVSAGEMYMVGERGMELFVPDRDGYIVSNQNLGAYSSGNPASGGVINGLTINVNGVGDPDRVAEVVVSKIEQQLRLQAVGR